MRSPIHLAPGVSCLDTAMQGCSDLLPEEVHTELGAGQAEAQALLVAHTTAVEELLVPLAQAVVIEKGVLVLYVDTLREAMQLILTGIPHHKLLQSPLGEHMNCFCHVSFEEMSGSPNSLMVFCNF